MVKNAERRALVSMLVSAGVPHKTAWSEVGYFLNRRPPPVVFAAISGVIRRPQPVAAAREALGLQ